MSVAKETVGRKAVDYIESGMVVGLGTGSTAYYFVDELGKRYASGQINQIRCVSTSTQTEQQAQSLGLPTVTLDEVDHIDVLVDGADETLDSFSGIKGGGERYYWRRLSPNIAGRLFGLSIKLSGWTT